MTHHFTDVDSDEPTDAASVLTQAADRLHTYARRDATTPPCSGWAGAEDFLRWLAKEARKSESQTTPATIAVVSPPAPTDRGPFVALGGPLTITPDAFCEHGGLAFAARLHGHHTKGDQHDEEMTVIFPRCYLAKILGAVLAIVDHDSSPEAHERFTDTVNQAQTAVATAIQRQADARNEEQQ
ncbi:hypothetical protein [Streptomyces sp. AK08-02]|uniref:hypothetical protein n=1 Tax=Streptomyces sp. AK08-02 TaxID=3028654 RepID=UPI0029A1C958|nr:hypothetical protein [Streptomyces sp. AK08-02]MDX3748708.1 hypothetical protein [Streptomyces sp. AK08-02]